MKHDEGWKARRLELVRVWMALSYVSGFGLETHERPLSIFSLLAQTSHIYKIPVWPLRETNQDRSKLMD